MPKPQSRAILVDDEPRASELLTILLRENCPEIIPVAICTNVDEAFEKINLMKPDVVFLDIKLGDETGFDLLTRFEHIFFQVVITTAYSNYALRAFDFSALHYLMKPVGIDQLRITAKRLESKMLYLKLEENYSNLAEGAGRGITKIAVASNSSTELIPLSDIEYLSAQGSYTMFHLKNNTQKLSSKILGHYHSNLPNQIFCRTHRKYIVNVDYVVEIDKSKSLSLFLNSGSSVQVSPAYKEELMQVLKRKISF